MENKSMDLGRASIPDKKDVTKEEHVPSKVQADTVFHFVPEFRYLLTYLKNKMISPRYCVEDLEYLSLEKIQKMAYPMKCFCDINMHRLEEHLYWYGYYGVAFSKEWGMHQGIQPVHYVNQEAQLREDFSEAFSIALQQETSKAEKEMKSYMLHQLMYYKPYSGTFKNRNTGEITHKCFTDECEWRYIPDVTPKGFQQVYFDNDIVNSGGLEEHISGSMEGIKEISLNFDYSDLKYVILKTRSDFNNLLEEMKSMNLSEQDKLEIVSKVIIWEESKGDF